eukprot:gene2522-1577_t
MNPSPGSNMHPYTYKNYMQVIILSIRCANLQIPRLTQHTIGRKPTTTSTSGSYNHNINQCRSANKTTTQAVSRHTCTPNTQDAIKPQRNSAISSYHTKSNPRTTQSKPKPITTTNNHTYVYSSLTHPRKLIKCEPHRPNNTSQSILGHTIQAHQQIQNTHSIIWLSKTLNGTSHHSQSRHLPMNIRHPANQPLYKTHNSTPNQQFKSHNITNQTQTIPTFEADTYTILNETHNPTNNHNHNHNPPPYIIHNQTLYRTSSLNLSTAYTVQHCHTLRTNYHSILENTGSLKYLHKTNASRLYPKENTKHSLSEINSPHQTTHTNRQKSKLQPMSGIKEHSHLIPISYTHTIQQTRKQSTNLKPLNPKPPNITCAYHSAYLHKSRISTQKSTKTLKPTVNAKRVHHVALCPPKPQTN